MAAGEAGTVRSGQPEPGMRPVPPYEKTHGFADQLSAGKSHQRQDGLIQRNARLQKQESKQHNRREHGNVAEPSDRAGNDRQLRVRDRVHCRADQKIRLSGCSGKQMERDPIEKNEEDER